jgi:hypothetical protein
MSSITGIRFMKRLGGDATADYVPPKLIRETQPDPPEAIGVSLQTEVRLNFRVSVDKNGRVDDVELLSTDTDHRLVGLADVAIRHWTFEPARIKDRAVSSKLIASVCFRSPYSRLAQRASSSSAADVRPTP